MIWMNRKIKRGIRGFSGEILSHFQGLDILFFQEGYTVLEFPDMSRVQLSQNTSAFK